MHVMAGPSVAPRRSPLLAVVPALAGAAVAVALGVYGKVYEPSGKALYIGPFASVLCSTCGSGAAVVDGAARRRTAVHHHGGDLVGCSALVLHRGPVPG